MAAAPQPKPLPIQCSATGVKFFAPAMTAAGVCARFVGALGAAMPSALPPGERLVVELRFLPHGVASAKVTQLRAGRLQSLPVYELAISDRQFAVTDVDSLARDVGRAIRAGTSRKGKG